MGWDDIVLPDASRGQLADLASRARNRDLVLVEWRMRTGGGRGRGVTALFAGDSGAGPHWAAIRDRLGPPGVALLPVGAYLPREIMQAVHMDPAEAVQARADLGARQAIGMHFGTFQLTDEAIDAPLDALQQARAPAGLPLEAFDVLGFGETRALPL